jgi:hypothetical protein
LVNDKLYYIDSKLGRLLTLTSGLHGNEKVLDETKKRFNLLINGKQVKMMKEVIAIMIRNHAKDVRNAIFTFYNVLHDVELRNEILLGLSYCIDADVIPVICALAIKCTDKNIRHEIFKRQLSNPYIYYSACETIKSIYDKIPSDDIIDIAFKTTKTKERLDLLLGFTDENKYIEVAEYNIKMCNLNKHDIIKYFRVQSKIKNDNLSE